MKTASYNHILKYTGLLGGVQALYILIAMVRGKVTALLIGAAGMGLADLFMRTIDLMGNATNFGIAFSAVRRLSSLHETGDIRAAAHYVRLIRTWTLLTALLGTAACLIFSPLISIVATGSVAATPSFLLIAPAVGLTTLTGGELAILKGTGRLKRLAAMSALGALGTLTVAIPIFAWLGMRGVVPVIVASALVVAGLNLRAATRAFPYRISLFRLHFLRQGGHLLRLGTAYIMAGIFGSGAELAIRSVLMRMGSGEETVGLYAASFTLTVSYARLIFMAMDADYFPRLSVAVARREEMNLCINRQTDILTVLIVPFLIVFALALPLVVRILYTEEFLPIVPMTICALAYMFFKAVFLPAAYLPLAAGHSRTFMLMELAYSIPFVGLVAGGYALGGLVGASIGLSASNAYNLVLVTVVYRRRYGFRFATATARRCLYQGLCLGGGLAAASLTDPLMKYGFGAAALTLSVALSWHMLGRETDLFQRFFRKKDR